MKKPLLAVTLTLLCCQLTLARPPAPPMNDEGMNVVAELEERPPGDPFSGGPPSGPPGALLEFLQQHLPERSSQLAELQGKDPFAYRRELHRLGRRIAPLTRLQRDDPGAFAAALGELKAEDKLQSLHQAYRAAGPEARPGLKEQMKPLLNQLFVARQVRERKRLEHTRKQLDQQEERLNQRQKLQQQIVERRLEDLTGDGVLRW